MVKNPQSNATMEHYHATMGNILRTMLHTIPTANYNDTNKMVDNTLSTCSRMHSESLYLDFTLCIGVQQRNLSNIQQ